MSQETVLVPDIGSDAAEVVEVLVAPGDTVEIDQGLVVLESDKASMEIPSTVAGHIEEVLTRVGAQLSEGDPVARVSMQSDGDAARDSEPASAPAAAEAPAPASADGEGNDAQDTDDVASPVVVAVPDIGTDEAVDLIEVSVRAGDEVARDDTLIVLESDKASMEVPAPEAGRILELLVSEGQSLRQGDPILRMAPTSGQRTAPPSAPAPAQKPAPSPPAASTAATRDPTRAASSSAAPTDAPAPSAPPKTSPPSSSASKVYAGPAVRRLARELGVELGLVEGSGPRGRILKDDVQLHVRRALEKPASRGAAIPEVPEPDFAAFGPVETVERSKIDRVTADNMQRSWLNVPHVTQFDDADITELEDFRRSLADEAKQRGTRLTPIPFLLKACAVALRRHEKLNASLAGGGTRLVYKRYVHIGMAVDTPAGLLVPVLRDVDRKSLWELAEEVIDLAGRARDRKLKPAEMQGASFTISSLGVIGGRGFTPIVNSPEVAILGVGRASQQPVWDGDSFQPRLMLPLALSYDHRVVNGGDGGRFLTELVQLLGDLRRQLL